MQILYTCTCFPPVPKDNVTTMKLYVGLQPQRLKLTNADDIIGMDLAKFAANVDRAG
jgi:hypothetical protein